MRLGLDGESIPLANPLEKVRGRVIEPTQVKHVVLRLERVPIFRLSLRRSSGGGARGGGGRGRGRGGGRVGEQAGGGAHG